ncbi:ester cyclase [Synechococcus sp. R55.6]|uniref:ester cyclase n=1 Tax=unclassified Synechococcus TaxID=2626047 RepID=UPI0039C37DB5
MSTSLTPAEIVRNYHTRLWGKGDLSAVEAFWLPTAKVHMTGFSGNGVEVVRADVERYFGAFSQVETQINHLIGERDWVVLHWTTSGFHVGTYDNIPATQKRITMTGIDLFRLEDGRFAECWSVWDGMSVYEQLGVLRLDRPESL